MKIVIFIYEGMTMLDAIGPYEVLRNLKDAEIIFVAKNMSPVVADSTYIEINPKYQINDISHADILLIPGSSVAYLRVIKDKEVLEWIRKMDTKTIKTTSVCTGAVILAAAGILKNKKATTHWKIVPQLADFGAIPTRERIVEVGKTITAAGVSAGIDMALYLVDQLEGPLMAKAAQLTIEYDPKPLYNSGNYLTADKEVIKASEQKMEEAAMKELSLWDMIRNAKTLLKMRKQ